MANNFRLSGITSPSYIDKDGNDGNSGLDGDNAKLTFARYAVNNIAGTGQYKGAFSLNTVAAQVANFYADEEEVKLLASADLVINSTSTTTTTFGLADKGGSFSFDVNGNNLVIKGGGTTLMTMENCIVENGAMHNAIIGDGFVNATYVNCVIRDITTGANGLNQTPNMTGCSIFNTSWIHDNVGFTGSEYSLNDCYVDANSEIKFENYFTTPATQFANNNFRGILNINGTQYELKREKDGTPINPNPGIADLLTIDANVYTNGNFSEDPGFLNIAKKDYRSVSDSSPNLLGGSTTPNIGNVKVSTVVKATDTAFSSPESSVDIITSSGDLLYDVLAATGSGVIVSSVMDLFPTAQQLKTINLAALLNFDSLEVVGSAENQQVPISDNYTTGTAGASPRRLTLELRWTDSTTAPTTATDYTNNNYTDPGEWIKFQWSRLKDIQPMIDLSGKGNGEPDYTSVGAVPILVKYCQVRLTIFEGIG